MNGITEVDDELERRSEFYYAEWLLDAVDRVLENKTKLAQNTMQSNVNIFGIMTADVPDTEE